MIYTIVEEQLFDKNSKKHAGGKAREDLNTIFSEQGFTEIKVICPQNERNTTGLPKKALYHHKISKIWRKEFSILEEGDVLILQFPVINHTILLNKEIRRLKKKGVKIVAFIHDLDILRRIHDENIGFGARWRMKKEEEDELKEFDFIVAHNERMRDIVSSRFNINKNKIKTIGVFDYLLSEPIDSSFYEATYNSCIIAGNLNRNKSAYIYNLPDAPDFELYGVNYETNCRKNNIHYHGSFLPEELPNHLVGGFGLVWDGDSIETCNGAWGEYLKYNNPHKTSLYLACGIPVIIWEKAALSEYVKTNNVGITVNSLNEIECKLRAISEEEYNGYKRNAIALSKKLRTGFYTRQALKLLGLIN